MISSQRNELVSLAKSVKKNIAFQNVQPCIIDLTILFCVTNECLVYLQKNYS